MRRRAVVTAGDPVLYYFTRGRRRSPSSSSTPRCPIRGHLSTMFWLGVPGGCPP